MFYAQVRTTPLSSTIEYDNILVDTNIIPYEYNIFSLKVKWFIVSIFSQKCK